MGFGRRWDEYRRGFGNIAYDVGKGHCQTPGRVLWSAVHSGSSVPLVSVPVIVLFALLSRDRGILAW